METPTVVLNRFVSDEKQTLGTWTVVMNNVIEFVCKTLELPNKDNAAQVSCIPSGVYDCVYSFSPSMKKYTYEILNVPNRSGVRIHSANFATQLRGCVALGSSHKDINSDLQLDVIHSGDTIKQFEKLMDYKPFKLIIK